MKRKLLLIVASLLFSGMIYAQDYYWSSFNYNQWQSYATVYGKVYLDGELQERDDIEVAAFVNGELRGREFCYQSFAQFGYLTENPCYSDVAGEVFTFMAYDHANSTLYDLCDVTITSTGIQDDFGSYTEPILMHFTKTEQPSYGPDYPWVPSSSVYPGIGMTVVAQIQINGENVERGTYEVGAFCGEECRGTSGEALVDWTDASLGYFAYFNIMGNDGDEINFYLYDIENEEICAVKCFQTVTLENEGELGTNIFGEVFVLNFVTEQTFTKNIEGYSDNEFTNGGYYLIASPFGEVKPTNVTNLLENEFDLYYFDQAQEMEWVNIKDGNTNLVAGKGYLYANSEDVQLVFKGFPYNGDGKVTLIKDKGENATTAYEGWNLVGNPYAQTAYVTKPFYTVNGDGNEIISVPYNSVEPAEGIFVVANVDGEEMQFSTQNPANNKSQIVLNVMHDRGTIIDRAIVRFGNESTLPKFMLNENNTKLYIPQDDNDYAVVTCGEVGEIPVSFKANHNGSFTINVNAEELDMNYMHLIDNLTGTDVDLLQNPSYNFNAQTTDYASRFKLVFATGVSNDDNFGFYSNGSWIINNDGDAILQVVDVIGRIMSSEEIQGSFNKRIEAAPGVYMLRLVKGDNVKVQKIVVK
jgi:hypothetical protein